jgi:WhiB family transcriptional regulator, redox-sensing transcriptional regulator
MDWRHRARCRDVDPELFFPVGTTGPAEAQVQSAKAICTLCTVREECLQWALDTAQDAGVWGGLSEEERRAMRRGQRRRVRIAGHHPSLGRRPAGRCPTPFLSPRPSRTISPRSWTATFVLAAVTWQPRDLTSGEGGM